MATNKMRAKKDFQFKAKHKNPKGGLNEAGRKAAPVVIASVPALLAR